MTFWADNLKFIKDILDSKYKKIEDAIAEFEDSVSKLTKEHEDKKAREAFIEAARALELLDINELRNLGETMIKDLPETEKHKEEDRLKEVEGKYTVYIAKVKEARKNFDIMGIK